MGQRRSLSSSLTPSHTQLPREPSSLHAVAVVTLNRPACSLLYRNDGRLSSFRVCWCSFLDVWISIWTGEHSLSSPKVSQRCIALPRKSYEWIVAMKRRAILTRPTQAHSESAAPRVTGRAKVLGVVTKEPIARGWLARNLCRSLRDLA